MEKLGLLGCACASEDDKTIQKVNSADIYEPTKEQMKVTRDRQRSANTYY